MGTSLVVYAKTEFGHFAVVVGKSLCFVVFLS